MVRNNGSTLSRTVAQEWCTRVGLWGLRSAEESARGWSCPLGDLEVDTDGVTTGAIQLCVQSPRDKAQWVERIRTSETQQAARKERTGGTLDPLALFVGDSANDLLAMLAADVGVSLQSRTDSSIERLAMRYGIRLVPLLSTRAS